MRKDFDDYAFCNEMVMCDVVVLCCVRVSDVSKDV